MTTLLAVLAATVVALTAAARIPPAAAELVRAFLPLAEALRELRAALTGRPAPFEAPPGPPAVTDHGKGTDGEPAADHRNRPKPTTTAEPATWTPDDAR